MAPPCGSYSRHSSFASVVLPAPFWPTMASDEPAGIVRSKPSSTRAGRAAGAGYANVTLRKRISRAGRFCAASRAPGPVRLPGPSPVCSRSTAPAGAAAPSSAHDNPPNAIMLVLTAALANVTAWPRSMRAAFTPNAIDANTATFADSTISRLHTTGRSRSRVASQRRSNSRRRCLRESLHGPRRQSEQPQFLRRRRVDREPIRIVGVTLRFAHLLGVAVAPHRAFAQQPMRGEPGARQHQRRPPRICGEQQRRREPGDELDQARTR